MTNGARRPGMSSLMAIVVAVGAIAWTIGPARASAQGAGTQPGAKEAAVARGVYLVNAMGCHDCHTPAKMGENGPEPDMTRGLIGHPSDLTLPPPPALGGPWNSAATDSNTAFAGPWGISYTRNLTPDKETGLGDWTEQQFVDTIRTGRRQGRGREILPPMPWPAFKNLNDADLKAIFAYLQSLPPVSNRVPEPVLAEPPR